MKNLIKRIENEQKSRLDGFITDINHLTERSQLDTWFYKDLLPKGKNVKGYSFDTLKAYLIDRKQKAIYKAIEREVNHINTVSNAGVLNEVTISIEWKKSRMWGNNPNAEASYSYSKDGQTRYDRVCSGSIGGCGYDKESTAIAQCLNQINEVLKPLYELADQNKTEQSLRELLGYGSGYGILPRIEGGVGASCYGTIFEKIGYKFSRTASGKTFDVYTITKIS